LTIAFNKFLKKVYRRTIHTIDVVSCSCNIKINQLSVASFISCPIQTYFRSLCSVSLSLSPCKLSLYEALCINDSSRGILSALKLFVEWHTICFSPFIHSFMPSVRHVHVMCHQLGESIAGEHIVVCFYSNE
jgi:hypothetical protein